MVTKARGQINQWGKIPNSVSLYILKNIFLDIIIIKLTVAVAITKPSRLHSFLQRLVSKKKKKLKGSKIFLPVKGEKKKKKGGNKKNWQNCKRIWSYKAAICTGDRLNVNSEQNMLNLKANNVNKKFVKLYLQKWHKCNTWNMFSKTSTKLFFSSRVATWRIYRLLIQSGSELWL